MNQQDTQRLIDDAQGAVVMDAQGIIKNSINQMASSFGSAIGVQGAPYSNYGYAATDTAESPSDSLKRSLIIVGAIGLVVVLFLARL